MKKCPGCGRRYSDMVDKCPICKAELSDKRASLPKMDPQPPVPFRIPALSLSDSPWDWEKDKISIIFLLLDTSGDLGEEGVRELNEGLRMFGEALQADPRAGGKVDVRIITFNKKVTEVSPDDSGSYAPLVLSAGGETAANEAIITGLDALETIKQLYRGVGISFFRPWLFLLTGGVPTDDEYSVEAHLRLAGAVEREKVNFFPLGVGQADIAVLKSYTPECGGPVMKAEKNHFREVFTWLVSGLSEQNSAENGEKFVTLPEMPSSITIDL